MTVNDLISDITSLRGQQYGTDMIMGWINEIEGQVIEEVINRAEGYNLEFIPMEYEKDQDKKLSISDRFKDVYVNYLLSKIDYNNDVVMYNSAYDAYAAWFRRCNRAKKAPLFSKF